MPDYPDITVYVEPSRERLLGQVLRQVLLQVQLLNPFVLRTALVAMDPGGIDVFAVDATRQVLQKWADRLRAESHSWPEKVTAFHSRVAVHGHPRRSRQSVSRFTPFSSQAYTALRSAAMAS